MELSIIIPTFNEEKFLPKLLKIVCAEEGDFEVIIADAGSKDKTKEIAENFGCKIIKGGLPARGRNKGAKNAKGDVLLFLDADINTSKGFVNKALREFKKRKLDVASFPIYTQEKNVLLNPVTLNIFYNYPQKRFQKRWPLGAMGIMVKKDIFKKVGGFDEEIKLSEDHYFVREASKMGSFGIINIPVFMPLRRFRQDGYLKTFLKYLACLVHMETVGPVKSDILDYRFGHYNKDNNKKK